MVPGPRSALCLDGLPQCNAHVTDAVGHERQLLQPHVFQLRRCQDLVHDGCAVLRRAGVSLADNDLQLRQHNLCSLFGGAFRMDVANALAVEPKVLGEGLGNEELEARGSKQSLCVAILRQVSACVALVRVVQERDELSLPTCRDDLVPLRYGRVHPGGVVRHRVEQDAFALLHLLNASHHARKVQATTLLVPVGIGLVLQEGASENLGMIAPSRIRAPHLLDSHELQELRNHLQRASAGQCLRSGDAATVDDALVEEQLLHRQLVLWLAINRLVLLVLRSVQDDQLFGLSHGGQDPGLALRCAVGAHTQIHLLLTGVGLEPTNQAQDGVRRRLRHAGEDAHD
mmetsp:Transcript_116540/g.277047  ORF Transcript_116540/g.277047 Transcript_116540/m.277047 type:complete len:343 (-) Transcript_116540:52-1080(-)